MVDSPRSLRSSARCFLGSFPSSSSKLDVFGSGWHGATPLTPLRLGCHYGFSEGDRSRRILHHDPGARDIYGTTSYGPAEFIGRGQLPLSGGRQSRPVKPLPVSFTVSYVI